MLHIQAAALDAAADGIMITDRDGAILWVNPAWVQMTGFSAEEAVGHTPRILKSGVQDAAFYEAFWQSVLAGRTVRGEIVNRRKDGTLYPEHETITPVLDAAGRVTHFIAIKQDITERRRAEAEIQRERDFTQRALDSLPGLFYLFDRSGRFLRWNRTYRAISGYTDEEIAQMSPLDFFREGEKSLIAERIREAFATGQSFAEASFVAKDGRAIPHYFTAQRFSFGEQPCLVGMGIDISDRLRLEAQLRQSQKMDAIGHLAGGVAHDINNILTVIQGNASLLRMSQAASAHHEEGLAEILEATQRAAELTRRLLALGRRQVMQLRRLDLNEIVMSMVKMLQRILGEDVRLHLDLHPRELPVRADAGMLDQVLLNLVVNARDAMPGGGTLTIESSPVGVSEADSRRLADLRPGQYARLRVADTGSGIAPEDLEHVFEPFFTTKAPGKGTGLGLATVFGIVKQHAGAVRVSSRLGEGSTFEILLPIDEAAAEASERNDPRPALRGGCESILVVEDEAPVRHLVTSMLEMHGYRVLAAQSGPDALALDERSGHGFDLLLTDLIMPGGISGRELAERLQERHPDLKVVYMSGYAGNSVEHGLQLHEGANFLGKPFSPQALLACIRARLDAG